MPPGPSLLPRHRRGTRTARAPRGAPANPPADRRPRRSLRWLAKACTHPVLGERGSGSASGFGSAPGSGSASGFGSAQGSGWVLGWLQALAPRTDPDPPAVRPVDSGRTDWMRRARGTTAGPRFPPAGLRRKGLQRRLRIGDRRGHRRRLRRAVAQQRGLRSPPNARSRWSLAPRPADPGRR